MLKGLIELHFFNPSQTFHFAGLAEQLNLLPLEENQLAVMGDAHGNWYLILLAALVHGLINLQALENDLALKIKMQGLLGEDTEKNLVDYLFQYLFSLYQSPLPIRKPFMKREIFKNHVAGANKRFRENIDRLTFCPMKSFLLMGDLFSDRGQSDDRTLYVIKKLKESLNLIILLSNHDAAFLTNFFRGLQRTPYIQSVSPMTSLTSIEYFVGNGGIDLDEINYFVRTAYLSSLKLFHYEQTGNTLILFTHAPFPLSYYQLVANYFEVEFDCSTLADLKQSMDKINQKFSAALEEDVNKIFNLDARGYPAIMRPQHPLYLLIWARWSNYNKGRLADPCTGEDVALSISKEDFIPSGLSYNIHYVYGHTNEPPPNELQQFCTSLDHYFGKGAFNPDADLSLEGKQQQLFPIYRTGEEMDLQAKAIINLADTALKLGYPSF